MTGSARRLPSGQTPISAVDPDPCCPRRAAGGAHRQQPQRLPVVRILFAIALAFVVLVGSLGGSGSLPRGAVASSPATADPAQSRAWVQPADDHLRPDRDRGARPVSSARRAAWSPRPRCPSSSSRDHHGRGRTFWANEGYDPAAMLLPPSRTSPGEGDSERGASRSPSSSCAAAAALEVVNGEDRYLRKIPRSSRPRA